MGNVEGSSNPPFAPRNTLVRSLANFSEPIGLNYWIQGFCKCISEATFSTAGVWRNKVDCARSKEGRRRCILVKAKAWISE